MEDRTRVTLCVSVVFAVVRCPSVRLSVALVYYIQIDEDIVKLLSRPGFLTPAAIGEPLQ